MFSSLKGFSRFKRIKFPKFRRVVNDLRARWSSFLTVSQYQGDWVSGGIRVTVNPTQLTEYTSAAPWFVYEPNGDMVFSGERLASSYNFRSELRHGPEWNPSGNNILDFEVELSDTTLSEYTFAQIHRKETFATQPPARLVWLASRSGIIDNIYVVLRRDTGSYQYFALGVKPTGKFRVLVQLNNLELTVSINDIIQYTGLQSDWSGYNCYFKIGAYLTGSTASTGVALVRYSSLATSSSIVNNIGFS
jgi:hypothetical protein